MPIIHLSELKTKGAPWKTPKHTSKVTCKAIGCYLQIDCEAPITENNIDISHWTQKNQAGAHTEPSPLLSSLHVTEIHAAHQRSLKTSIYNRNLLVWHTGTIVGQMCGSNEPLSNWMWSPFYDMEPCHARSKWPRTWD